MRTLYLSVALILPLICGCRVGAQFRELSLDSDLRPGDLSYYQERARIQNARYGAPLDHASDHLVVEEGSVGFPLIALPLVWQDRRTLADRVDSSQPYHFSARHAFGTLIVVFTGNDSAKFDADGRNLSARQRRGLLLGMIGYVLGHEVLADGRRAPTSGFSILWGMFSVAWTPYGTRGAVFWFPINGEETTEAPSEPEPEPETRTTTGAEKETETGETGAGTETEIETGTDAESKSDG